MISEKLIEISNYYSHTDKTKDEMVAYCNQYDIIFFNFIDEIEKECSKDLFEALDEIFMLCDSFEPNEEIRNEEPYCIGEKELQNKIQEILRKLDTL